MVNKINLIETASPQNVDGTLAEKVYIGQFSQYDDDTYFLQFHFVHE